MVVCTEPADLLLSVVVIQELRFGIELLLNEKRRKELEVWLAGDVLQGLLAAYYRSMSRWLT